MSAPSTESSRSSSPPTPRPRPTVQVPPPLPHFTPRPIPPPPIIHHGPPPPPPFHHGPPPPPPMKIDSKKSEKHVKKTVLKVLEEERRKKAREADSIREEIAKQLQQCKDQEAACQRVRYDDDRWIRDTVQREVQRTQQFHYGVRIQNNQWPQETREKRDPERPVIECKERRPQTEERDWRCDTELVECKWPIRRTYYERPCIDNTPTYCRWRDRSCDCGGCCYTWSTPASGLGRCRYLGAPRPRATSTHSSGSSYSMVDS